MSINPINEKIKKRVASVEQFLKFSWNLRLLMHCKLTKVNII